MGNGLRIGRFAGVDVHLDWTLLIVFLLITVSLGGSLFPAWHPDWTPAQSWLTGLAAALLFFVSVLLHEMSHALVGRRNGIDVRRITLFVFGGMAHMENEPRAWRAEFWMAIVGPITSLVIGVVCTMLAVGLGGLGGIDPDNIQAALAGLGMLPTLLLWLGQINILLALFNLVPGFPLDGGRVLRSVLWGMTGSLRRATRWAAAAGQGVAWLLIASGFAMMLGFQVPIFGTGFIGGVWIALIGWFLNNAALLSYRQLVVRESLADVKVGALMETRFATVVPDLPLDRLVEDYMLRSAQRGYPVVTGERILGLVCLEDIRKVEQRAWPDTSVREVMTPAQDLASVSPQDDAQQALSLLGDGRVNQLPVIEHGAVRGLVRREDILKWLSLRRGNEQEAQLALGGR